MEWWCALGQLSLTHTYLGGGGCDANDEDAGPGGGGGGGGTAKPWTEAAATSRGSSTSSIRCIGEERLLLGSAALVGVIESNDRRMGGTWVDRFTDCAVALQVYFKKAGQLRDKR